MNLRFVVPGHPPTANERLHHFELAKRRRAFRDDATLVARDAKNRSNGDFPLGPVRLSFNFVFPTFRVRDLDNLVGSVKPIIDGIVDAGIIYDDSLDHVREIRASARVDPAIGSEIVVNIETVS